MAIGYEALCIDCGESFNPHPSEYSNDDQAVFSDEDLEHYQREDGSPCGGRGELVGEWS